MKRSLLLIFLLALFGFTVSAAVYRITRLNMSPIIIDGKEKVVNDTFPDFAKIVFKKNQSMEVIDITTGRPYTATEGHPKKGKESVSKPKVSDFLQTRGTSTRDAAGNLILDFTRSQSAGDFAEKRAALVIGNSNYKSLSKLRNSQGDAVAVSNELLSLGFDVMELYEANGDDMKDALIDFGRKAKDYDVALFYYAGHGIQDDGHNFLVPVDKQLELRSELRECLMADDVTSKFEGLGAATKVIIFDACRNAKKSWTRGEEDGLVQMEPGPHAVLVFSTGIGRVALDGDGEHSPFAETLLENLHATGLTVSELLDNTVNETYRRTRNSQLPYKIGTLGRNIVLNTRGAKQTANMASAAPASERPAAQPAPSTPIADGGITLADFEAQCRKVYKIKSENSGFKILPISTRRAGDKLIMEILLMNMGQKLASFILYGDKSIAIDNLGNAYRWAVEPWYDIPPGIPVKKKIVISNVDEDAEAITNLQIIQAYNEDTRFEASGIPMNMKLGFPRLQELPEYDLQVDAPNIEVEFESIDFIGNGKANVELTITNTSSRTINNVRCELYHTNPWIAIDENGAYVNYESCFSVDKNNFTLPAGVATPLKITISDLSPDASQFQYLRLCFSNMDPDVQYSNIVLRKLARPKAVRNKPAIGSKNGGSRSSGTTDAEKVVDGIKTGIGIINSLRKKK